MADARDLKSLDRMVVRVRPPPPAPLSSVGCSCPAGAASRRNQRVAAGRLHPSAQRPQPRIAACRRDRPPPPAPFRISCLCFMGLFDSASAGRQSESDRWPKILKDLRSIYKTNQFSWGHHGVAPGRDAGGPELKSWRPDDSSDLARMLPHLEGGPELHNHSQNENDRLAFADLTLKSTPKRSPRFSPR
jgi:hypothetical protein